MASKVSHSTQSNVVPNQCSWCNQSQSTEKKLLQCGACHLVKYCDKECQKKAWPEHKQVCVKAKNLQSKTIISEAAATVQEDEEIRVLRAALEKEAKVNPNPFINPPSNSASPYLFLNPSFYGQQQLKDFKICELALQCLQKGAIDLALQYIEDETMDPIVRKKFFGSYARKMVELDVKNVSIVLAKGPYLIPGGKEIRRIVVDQLCLTKQFEAAFTCAKEEKNPEEQKYLLNVVSAGKEIAEK